MTGWEIFRITLAFGCGAVVGLVLTCCIVAGKDKEEQR